MKKLRPKKSMFASGSAQKVRIDGAPKVLTREQLYGEVQGLLKILAGLVEQNRGVLSVSNETLQKVGQEGRVLQIDPGQFGVMLKFKEEVKDGRAESNREPETEGSEADGVRAEGFYDSEFARETREYLRNQRSADVGETG